MNTEEMEKLYNEEQSFKMYVDRICHTYNISKEKAFKDALVKSYAQYVITDQPHMTKEGQYESKKNCGC